MCKNKPVALGPPLTFSKYLSRISWPQLAHTFLPVDGTELAVEVGEHTEGVDGLLGDVSSRSMLDRCDSPSEWDCKRRQEQSSEAQKAARSRGGRRHRRHLPRPGASHAETGTEAHHWRAFRVRSAARCPRGALMLGGDHLEDSVQSAFIALCLIFTWANPREASPQGGSPYLKYPRGFSSSEKSGSRATKGTF